MRILKLVPVLVICGSVVSGCVAPEVVATNTVSDDAMSCQDIGAELGRLQAIRTEARKGKSASGENIAAAIFFWPAILGNYANANEALEAVNKRNEVLVKLSKEKGCRFRS